MKGSYNFIDHTADRRMVIVGASLEDLFRQGFRGLRELLEGDEFNNRQSNSEIQRRIELESPDRTTLLVDFLSEVLTSSHIDKAVFTRVVFKQMEETRLSGKLSGCRVKGFAEEVKAVTYHEAEVTKNDEGFWQSTIIFDI